MDNDVMQVITGYAHKIGIDFKNNERLKRRFTFRVIMEYDVSDDTEDMLSEYFNFIDWQGRRIYKEILREEGC